MAAGGTERPPIPALLARRTWRHWSIQTGECAPEWIRCTYRCGRYEVRLYDVRPKIDEKTGKPKDAQTICEELINLKRAEEHARSKDAALRLGFRPF